MKLCIRTSTTSSLICMIFYQVFNMRSLKCILNTRSPRNNYFQLIGAWIEQRVTCQTAGSAVRHYYKSKGYLTLLLREGSQPGNNHLAHSPIIKFAFSTI